MPGGCDFGRQQPAEMQHTGLAFTAGRGSGWARAGGARRRVGPAGFWFSVNLGMITMLAFLTRSSPGRVGLASAVARDGEGPPARYGRGCVHEVMRLRGGKPIRKRGSHRVRDSESEEDGEDGKDNVGSYSVSSSSKDEDWNFSVDTDSADADKPKHANKGEGRKQRGLSKGTLRPKDRDKSAPTGRPRMFSAPRRELGEDTFGYDAYGDYGDDEMISVNDESEDRDKFSKLKFGGEEQQNDHDKRGPTNVVVDDDEEEEDGEQAVKLTKAQRKKLLKQGLVIGGDNMNDVSFGRRPEDLVDGGAFEERIGTYGPDENRFALPPEVERKIKKGADPLVELGKLEEKAELIKAKMRAKKKRKNEGKEKEELKARGHGVMYVGRIPYAFEEEQQFQYFSQFGKVLNVRLSKNPKTGKNRGHGWVLWDDYDVGQQVAEYMDGYYMYGKTLHVNMVPNDKVHPDMWRNAGRKFRKINWSNVEQLRQLRPKSAEQQKRCDKRRLARNLRAEKKLLKRMPDFEFDETNSERVYLEKLKAREALEAANAVNGTHPDVPVPTIDESVRRMCYGKGGSCTSAPIDVKAGAKGQDWDDSLSDL